MPAAPRRRSVVAAALALGLTPLAACGSGTEVTEEPGAAAGEGGSLHSTEPTDAFPVTVPHKFGETVVRAEPQRIVVVGLTEQDVLLQLGVIPLATTEWYGEQPFAVWPWARDLLGGAEPEVLDQTDGLQLERIAALAPDLIVGTNAGLDEQQYASLAAIAPTVTSVEGSERYFSSWQDQTRQIAKAVGRSAAGDDLVTGIEQAFATAAAEHPEFAGRSATFTQGIPYENNLYVYPDGVNTDFLTDLGFVITPGLEVYAETAGEQALISPERTDLLEADVMVVATEDAASVPAVLGFGTMASLDVVTGGRTVFTDAELAGAIYFLTPLSLEFVLANLVPQLVDAVAGNAPRTVVG